jgi:hypothetical protein
MSQQRYRQHISIASSPDQATPSHLLAQGEDLIFHVARD